jgi:hypothetical protein
MIAINHGNLLIAGSIFIIMQIGAMFLLRHQLKLNDRYWRLYEDIARSCLNNPKDSELRALLCDIAATHPAEIGVRTLCRDFELTPKTASRSSDPLE